MAAHYQTEENSGFNKDTSRLASTDLSTQDEGARPVCNAKRKSKPKHIYIYYIIIMVDIKQLKYVELKPPKKNREVYIHQQ